MTYAMAFLIGVVAGLRTMTALAAASWAARVGWLNLQSTPLAFLGAAATPWIFTAAALGEIVKAECGILESDSPDAAATKLRQALPPDDPD